MAFVVYCVLDTLSTLTHATAVVFCSHGPYERIFSKQTRNIFAEIIFLQILYSQHHRTTWSIDGSYKYCLFNEYNKSEMHISEKISSENKACQPTQTIKNCMLIIRPISKYQKRYRRKLVVTVFERSMANTFPAKCHRSFKLDSRVHQSITKAKFTFHRWITIYNLQLRGLIQNYVVFCCKYLFCRQFLGLLVKIYI